MDGDRLIKDFTALEMKRQLPGELPFKLKSAALELTASKVAAAELVTKTFSDSSAASFRLPSAVLDKTKCRNSKNSTCCGVNIQVKTWDPSVHGMEVSVVFF